MRFCEYIQEYREATGWTYVGIARECGLVAPTIRAHCHGRSFPRYEVFCNYFGSHVLNIHDAVMRTGCVPDDYGVDLMLITDLYDYFKCEERKYRRENKV